MESSFKTRVWSRLIVIVRLTRLKPLSFCMLAEFERHGLFQKVGEKATSPVPFVQSIDDYIESYHARSGFSRERMG